MIALNRYRLRHLVKEGKRSAIISEKLLERPDRLIGLILLGNNLVNFFAASIATVIGIRLLGDIGVALAPIILVLVFLIFAEVMPKTIAAINPEKIALPASYVLNILMKLAYPAVWLINAVSNNLLSVIGINIKNRNLLKCAAIVGAANNQLESSAIDERLFKNKIVYVPVLDMPDGDNPWIRENFQRNCIFRGLKNTTEDDLIIISDLDEIPNPEVINNFQTKMRYAVFKQRHFYYKLNLASKKNPYWYGSRICIKKYLKSPQWLRNLKFKKRPFWRIDKFRLNNIFEDGGWHFCNLKNPEQLLYKYKNLCETNDPYVFEEKIDEKFLDVKLIEQNIKLGLDIIGRDDSYCKIEIDKSFPEFLTKNINKFKEFIV